MRFPTSAADPHQQATSITQPPTVRGEPRGESVPKSFGSLSPRGSLAARYRLCTRAQDSCRRWHPAWLEANLPCPPAPLHYRQTALASVTQAPLLPCSPASSLDGSRPGPP